jgi:hypothetical protein
LLGGAVGFILSVHHRSLLRIHLLHSPSTCSTPLMARSYTPPLVFSFCCAPPASNYTRFSIFLGTAPLFPSPPLNGWARPSSPKTRACNLCQTGWQSGRTAGTPSCCTDSTVLVVYRSPTGRLRDMEASVVAVQRSGVDLVCGASGPWGWPRGPTEMRVIRRITDAPTSPVTIVMRHSSSSSSLRSSSP